MTDINANMWASMEATISAFGSAKKAKELRFKYFNPDMTDEAFEKIWAIFAAELRQAMEKVYEKYDVDPNDIRPTPRRRGVRPPKDFNELKEVTQRAKARKAAKKMPTFKKLEGDLHG